MAEFAGKNMEKATLADLLAQASRTPEERSAAMHDTLKIGLARCALRLGEMPFGMCNAPSIKRVAGGFVQDFRKIHQYERHHGHKGFATQEYSELTQGIFNAQKGTMLDIAKGVFEYNEDLNTVFGKELELAEVRQDVPAIRGVEASLDQFFTERLTMRLLISHTHNLAEAAKADPKKKTSMVGVVNTNTQPLVILSRAFTAVRFMCKRDFTMTPDLMVNGVPHDEYIKSEQATQHFNYVHTHLFYILLELLKNAARASVIRGQADHEAAGGIGKPKLKPIQIFLPEDSWGAERSVKIADEGTGMNRQVLGKAWSYYYSSVKGRPTVSEELSDFDKKVPIAGFGFGLPVSRVMARYFEGNMDLNSIPGKGTDVYIYL